MPKAKPPMKSSANCFRISLGNQRFDCPMTMSHQFSSATQTLSERFDPRTLAALEGLDFKARYIMEGFLSGLHNSPFHCFSVEFSDYRKYQAGDDLRHLDWRLYARSDRLCIKRYMQETNVRFYVLCDIGRASCRERV